MSSHSLVDDHDEEGGRVSPARGRARTAVGVTLLAFGLVAGCAVLARRPDGVRKAVRTGLGLEQEITRLDEAFNCAEYPYLQYDFQENNPQAAVLHNNLCGKGPDHGAEGLVFRTLDIGKPTSPEFQRSVLMVVNCTDAGGNPGQSPNFHPFASHLFGMQGKYGSINMNSGSDVHLKYTFYDEHKLFLEGKEKAQLHLHQLAMTLFDLDTGLNMASQECVEIGGFEDYNLTYQTEVKVSDGEHGRKRFCASTYGTGADNPKDPMSLTQQQMNRAVTALFNDVLEIDIKMSASAGKGPRFFTFVMRPSLLCALALQKGAKPPESDLLYHLPLQQPATCDNHKTFQQYFVNVGEDVHKGQGLFQVADSDGTPSTVMAPYAGKVVKRQNGLIKGDDCTVRLGDKAAVVVELPKLAPLPGQGQDDVEPTGPGHHGDLAPMAKFVKYTKKTGEQVEKGEGYAVIKQAGHDVTLHSDAAGILKQCQDLHPGDFIKTVADLNLCTLDTSGKFPPLPQTRYQASNDFSSARTASGGATVASADKDSLKFVQFHVSEGDSVEEGAPIATVKDTAGKEYVIKAARTGVVKHLQNGLREGMVLSKVLDNENVATIGRIPALDVNSGERGSFAARTGGPVDSWHFDSWLVEVGDNVAENEAVAKMKNNHGLTQLVRSKRAGTVTERLEQLQKGDVVSVVSQDSDLVTVGKFAFPDLDVRELPVTVELDDIFEEWLVDEGDRVHSGDPIARVSRGVPAADGTRRLAGQSIKIPSPGTGSVSYEAPLKPGVSIRDQSVGPSIAKVDLGLPWWLLLLAAMLVLCCCFGCLYQVMKKPTPVYKPMPPVEATPEPEPTPPPPPPPPARSATGSCLSKRESSSSIFRFVSAADQFMGALLLRGGAVPSRAPRYPPWLAIAAFSEGGEEECAGG
uniref:Uncharacterized protein n=1 Tax=Alexandrium andersonii TaxID=327968 RepID=A0A7S2NK09_9DINO|mmetsp:Transcript_99069/g.221970  ORF Transcript_99069/g.221970 Transcript_99069/m.221970 type:complete len:915 (+) Transcript_99069:59-2803(+)